MGLFETSRQLATLYASSLKRRLENRGRPNTITDAGGTMDSYSFGQQDLDRNELRQAKHIRERGGLVAQLFHTKALIKFGTGAELQAEDDELEAWLQETFTNLDDLVLDLGEDAIWFPYGLGEIVPSATGRRFGHIQLVEPWTMLPEENEYGDILGWTQETEGRGRESKFYPEGQVGSIILNKASGRDNVGVSEVLRTEEEITQYKQNQRAVNKAIEVAGFPHHHWTIGKDGQTPVSDDELRRVRNLIDQAMKKGDSQIFTGPAVEHNRIEAGDMPFAEITERDLRMLTSAIGLPFELVGYGSDGLGSGHEAELKMDLLAIQNEADRRRFGQQFVSEFVKPVIREFSEFDPNAEVTLEIKPFLDDKDDMASLIKQVGNYMTTDEVRERLNLSPVEDDDVGESFVNPAKQEGGEEAEEGDDPLAGLFGSDRTLNGRQEERYYLQMLNKVAWADDTDRQLVAFSESEIPEMVKQRLRDSIRGGALFSDFETISSDQLFELREFFIDTLEDEGWTLDGMAEKLSNEFGVDRDRAETIARTETQAVVNQARNAEYNAQDPEGDYRFKWVGTEDGRTTDACSWLKGGDSLAGGGPSFDGTNPEHGGEPVGLKEMQDLIKTANEEFVDHAPREYTPHINCRHTFVRAVGSELSAAEDRRLETYDDYPEAAQKNARQALDAREDTGNPNDCGTDVGWERANQLDNGENLSKDTISRMAAFERHEDNAEMDDDEGRADCGWMMYKAWGGKEGIAWAQRKLDELAEEGDREAQATLAELATDGREWAERAFLRRDVDPSEWVRDDRDDDSEKVPPSLLD